MKADEEDNDQESTPLGDGVETRSLPAAVLSSVDHDHNWVGVRRPGEGISFEKEDPGEAQPSMVAEARSTTRCSVSVTPPAESRDRAVSEKWRSAQRWSLRWY